MNRTMLGYIADILSVVSFVISLGIFRKIYAKTETQKKAYNKERNDLLSHLLALRQNIWNDGLTSIKIQDQLETEIFTYQIKYLLISSPRCVFHAFRCTYLLKYGINEANSAKVRQDINFLIARLSKKE